MYNEYEKEEKRDYSLLKKFLMNLILIVIFILLLVWLVPWPNMSGLNGLAPLQEQIFSNNIDRMKEAAITYYTTERLPQNVGDKKTLTLEEMLDLHLLTPFVDKNGNTCSLTESYVTIEKVDHDEYNYVMKVNLKCSDKEDYVMVYLGCYTYCEGAICEKEKENDEKPAASPYPTKTPTPTKTPKPTTSPSLSPTPTLRPSATPTPTKSPEPTKTPTPTKTPVPTKTPTPTATPVPTKTPTPTATPTPTPVVKYEYEYKKEKTTAAVYSEWSAWSYWSYNDNDVINWNQTATYQIEDLGAKKVQIGTQVNTAVVERDVQTKVMTKEYKVCTSYKYEADATKVYKIVSDWAYTDEYYKGYNPPADTMTTRWILQDYKVNECEGTCTNHVYLVYRQQTRKVETYTEYTNITASCANVETRSVDFYITTKDVQTLETKVPLYGYKKYYRDRTRSLITAATTTFDYTWSKVQNDPELIKAGWVATGEKRKIS